MVRIPLVSISLLTVSVLSLIHVQRFVCVYLCHLTQLPLSNQKMQFTYCKIATNHTASVTIVSYSTTTAEVLTCSLVKISTKFHINWARIFFMTVTAKSPRLGENSLHRSHKRQSYMWLSGLLIHYVHWYRYKCYKLKYVLHYSWGYLCLVVSMCSLTKTCNKTNYKTLVLTFSVCVHQ